MNKQFEEFIRYTKKELKRYEIAKNEYYDAYDEKDIEMMQRLHDALYPNQNNYVVAFM